jgi:spore germination protein GerM
MVTACTASVDEQARVIDDAEVPFELLVPATPAGDTTTTTAAPSGIVRPVYLVAEDGLVAVERTVDDPSPEVLIAELVNGPSQTERDDGLSSPLADGRDDEQLIAAVELARGVATVDLAAGFTSIPADRQVGAIAQIVLTLTAQPGIGQVAFTLEASPVDVPRADGTTTTDPLARSDYRDLLAPP